MKRYHYPRSVLLVVALAGLGTGCSTVRENIISSVNTGFGIQVTQNPQTQVPEVKVGYVRSQFYSIPTAKTVGKIRNNLSPTATAPLNDPSKTPELVSGIKAGASSKSGIVGMDIAENFAVGHEAVNSRAAIAMYIAQANNAQSATAAAASLGSEDARSIMDAVNDPDNEAIRKTYDELLGKSLKEPKPKKPDGSDYGSTAEYAEAEAGKIRPGGTAAEVRVLGRQNLRQLNERLQKAVTP